MKPTLADAEEEALRVARLLHIEAALAAAIETVDRHRQELERLKTAIAALDEEIQKRR